MSIRHASRLAVLPLALLIALAACQPAADKAADATPASDAAPADAPAEPAQDPALAGTDATAVVHHAQPDPAGFDRKAFAGTFSGTLPCADCPGLDTSLQISDDGTFTLTETRQDRGATETRGTWAVDADGKRLLLDPDTKETPDRHYELVSNAEIRALDPDGNPIATQANLSLRRN